MNNNKSNGTTILSRELAEYHIVVGKAFRPFIQDYAIWRKSTPALERISLPRPWQHYIQMLQMLYIETSGDGSKTTEELIHKTYMESKNALLTRHR